jgi:hypothetical protein
MGRCSLQGLRYLWRVVRGVAQCGGRPSSMAQKSFFKMAGPSDAIFRALAPGMRLRSPFWRSALLDKRLAVMCCAA